METEKPITGIDCGKNTWITLLASDTGAAQNLAGRTVFEVAFHTELGVKYYEEHKMDIIRVGPYDDKIMPAAVLYGSPDYKLNHECEGQASRYMFDIQDGNGAGEYSRKDIVKDRLMSNGVDSVMLRSGYAIQLFE